MHFPVSPRLVFARNPLAEVICQVRYPRVLRLEAGTPADFQESIWSAYPNVSETKALSVPPGMISVAGIDLANSARNSFEFSSESGAWRVSLTSQFLSVSTTEYTTWADFLEQLNPVLDAFSKHYGDRKFTRLGLRYRNVIQRSVLGLAQQPWSTLIRRELLGEVVANGLDGFEDDVERLAREVVFRRDEATKIRLYHGFGQIKALDETCYMIDVDCFHPGKIRSNDAGAILDGFNTEIGNLFRWCLTSSLREAMAPQKE